MKSFFGSEPAAHARMRRLRYRADLRQEATAADPAGFFGALRAHRALADAYPDERDAHLLDAAVVRAEIKRRGLVEKRQPGRRPELQAEAQPS